MKEICSESEGDLAVFMLCSILKVFNKALSLVKVEGALYVFNQDSTKISWHTFLDNTGIPT